MCTYKGVCYSNRAIGIFYPGNTKDQIVICAGDQNHKWFDADGGKTQCGEINTRYPGLAQWAIAGEQGVGEYFNDANGGGNFPYECCGDDKGEYPITTGNNTAPYVCCNGATDYAALENGSWVCKVPRCGDGIIQVQEQCDGSSLGGQTCTTLGLFKGTLACKSDCTFDTSKCTNCGDGNIQSGEQCDGHMTVPCQNLSTSFTSGTAFCLQDCKYSTNLCTGPTGGWCGDGIVTIGEQCDSSVIRKCSDFGFLSGNISCTNCMYDTSKCTRTTNCTADSDGGYDIFKRGTKTISGTIYTEECGGDSFTEYPYLYEYDCSRQNAYVVGRTEGSTYYEGVRGGCINGCFNGRCLPQKYDLTCTDSDNTPMNGYGEGRYTKGTTKSTVKQTGEVEEQQDRCFPNGEASVVEFICRPNGFIARTGVQCEVGCSDGACIKPRCGDDIFTFGYEECEGTNLGDQTCESLEAGYGTISCTSDCRLNMSGCVPATCGDGIINDDRWMMEECDGNDLNYRDCQSFGYLGGNLTCTNKCKFDKSGCFSTYCGDNKVQQPNDLGMVELCDGYDLNNRDCTSFGKAYLGGMLSCNADCTYDLSECITGTYCGDTRVQHPNDAGIDEQCDGNDLEGFLCTNFADYTGGTLSCFGDCTFDFSGCLSSGWCNDTDYGRNFYNSGTVYSNTGTYSDSCNGNVIDEWYCSNGIVREEVYTCPYGCVNNACVSIGCNDTDGGESLYVKGTCIGNGYPNGISDICSGSYVQDYICHTDSLADRGVYGMYGDKPYCIASQKPCPNGCSNGACI
jgi:hypothetical protein